jgi:hypothetical protein
MLIVLKSGSGHFLEPSGLLQSCNGIALPLPLLLNNRGIYSENLNSSEKSIAQYASFIIQGGAETIRQLIT